MSMIAIVDYGMGNLRSVSKAFEHLGHRVSITRDPRALSDAGRVVLPGVGAFRDCMNNLRRFDLVEPICQAIKSGKPFMGICLGLQLLFTESEEFGIHQGMDILQGRVVRLNPSASFKVPHIGWNQLMIKKKVDILKGMADGSAVYFVHSYYVIPEDRELICTETEYGLTFTSSIFKDNIFACQFHPEKSQAVGLKLLDNFARWDL
jgi:imidazole glycerol-phosphate synthase subunit HisH